VAAAGTADGEIAIWPRDSQAEPTLLTAHESAVRFVAFVNNGKSLISGAEDSTIRLWDVGTRTERAQANLSERGDVPSAVLVLPGSTEVLVGTSRGTILQFRILP
jgi:WD40 repeat protein